MTTSRLPEGNAAAATAVTVIHVATATVQRAGETIELSWRERELMAAVAAQSRPVSTEVLAGLLYPDRADDDSARMVKVYVYRLRQRVSSDFIVRRDGGYSVGPCVEIDLAQAQRIIEQLSQKDSLLDESQRDYAIDLARELRYDSPVALLDSEWWPAVARRARRLGYELAMSIGWNALRKGAYRVAHGVARDVTYDDPTLEEAWELLIRAELSLGEQAAAFRNFRCYEAMLAQDLELVPSAHIRKLVYDARDVA